MILIEPCIEEMDSIQNEMVEYIIVRGQVLCRVIILAKIRCSASYADLAQCLKHVYYMLCVCDVCTYTYVCVLHYVCYDICVCV